MILKSTVHSNEVIVIVFCSKADSFMQMRLIIYTIFTKVSLATINVLFPPVEFSDHFFKNDYMMEKSIIIGHTLYICGADNHNFAHSPSKVWQIVMVYCIEDHIRKRKSCFGSS